MAQGLEFLHSINIIHRDIKPQNILITEENGANVAKITDFGVASVYDENDIVATTEGTFHFMPPEACDPNVFRISGKAADVWALGVTLFCLCYNRVPYMAETDY